MDSKEFRKRGTGNISEHSPTVTMIAVIQEYKISNNLQKNIRRHQTIKPPKKAHPKTQTKWNKINLKTE